MLLAVALGLGLADLAGAAAAGVQVTDRLISATVEDHLADDRAVDANAIEVRTEQGVVTLSGTVGNILSKERATRIAELVKGVRTVVNDIAVTPPEDRTAAEIRKDIGLALATDPATDPWEVDASVSAGGEVTLTGTVNSWQEKRLAGKVAKGVRGVTALDNALTVRDVTALDNALSARDIERGDFEIARDVRSALKWDLLVDHGLIDVEVTRGIVRLYGTVGSAAEKRRAILDAHVRGVIAVDADRLKVERWARDQDLLARKFAPKPDEEIQKAVKDALRHDPRVDTKGVQASVREGKVTLRGTVGSVRGKRAAEQDAKNTVGVSAVENRLEVRPDEELSDEALAERVRAAFERDPYLARYDIEIDVASGVARLEGEVGTFFEKARADRAAAAVGGVTRVENGLSVRDFRDPYAFSPYVDPVPPSAFEWYADDYEPRRTRGSDSAIEASIERELSLSPFVSGQDIEVSVDAGVATLTGTVESPRGRAIARETAYRGGAAWVINKLKVRGEAS